jgi:hypothetical protein
MEMAPYEAAWLDGVDEESDVKRDAIAVNGAVSRDDLLRENASLREELNSLRRDLDRD